MIISTILFAIAKSSFDSVDLLVTIGATSASCGGTLRDTASIFGHEVAGVICEIIGLVDGAV